MLIALAHAYWQVVCIINNAEIPCADESYALNLQGGIIILLYSMEKERSKKGAGDNNTESEVREADELLGGTN